MGTYMARKRAACKLTPRIIIEPHIDRRTDQSIRLGLCICFPDDVEFYSKTRGWNQYDPYITAVVERDNRVVAHAAAIDKGIAVGRHTLRAAGIMNVFVLPGYRNQGLAAVVVRAALEEAERQEFDMGLLFCKSRLEYMYSGAGWRKIKDRHITRVVGNSELPLRPHIISMCYPLKLKTLPPGDIHLRGNEW
jgi:GNAT superfamily N-acetyltransferase